MNRIACIVAIAAAAGCAPAESPKVAELGPRIEPALATWVELRDDTGASRAVYAPGETIHFFATLTNSGDTDQDVTLSNCPEAAVEIDKRPPPGAIEGDVPTEKVIGSGDGMECFAYIETHYRLAPGEKREFQWDWNQADGSGQPVPPGFYFAQARYSIVGDKAAEVWNLYSYFKIRDPAAVFETTLASLDSSGAPQSMFAAGAPVMFSSDFVNTSDREQPVSLGSGCPHRIEVRDASGTYMAGSHDRIACTQEIRDRSYAPGERTTVTWTWNQATPTGAQVPAGDYDAIAIVQSDRSDAENTSPVARIHVQ